MPPDLNRKHRRRLRALARSASAAALWERAWPCLVLSASASATFLTASWSGAWTSAPAWGRMTGVALFGAAAAGPLLWFAAKPRLPGFRENIDRADREGGVEGRPAGSCIDRPAAASDDPLARAAWEAHLGRMAEALERVAPAKPRPRLAERDPYALRFLPVLAAVASWAAAGPHAGPRLAEAFQWSPPPLAPAVVRIDAWVSPPAYTGIPPFALESTTAPKKAPWGSRISVRVSGGNDPGIAREGGLVPADDFQHTSSSKGEWTLSGDGALRVTDMGKPVAAFPLEAVPDRAPTATWDGEPAAERKGLKLPYSVSDDYGAVSARAEFRALPGTGRTLAPPPSGPLEIPPGGKGTTVATLDLTAHLWAGADVRVSIAVADASGQEGSTAPRIVRLPQRVFTEPLARAFVEMRRELVFSPDARSRVAEEIDALEADQERFGAPTWTRPLLAAVRSRVAWARSDADLLDACATLWEAALALDQGSGAKDRLDKAAEALKRAIERGAAPDEIDARTRELREAMEQAMRKTAAKPRREGPPSGPVREVSPEDLARMADEVARLGKEGRAEESAKLLDELRSIMESLAEGQSASAPAGGLEDLAREQGKLRDETSGPGSPPSGQELGDRQSGLAERLRELREGLARQGAGDAPGLGDAQEAMKDAEKALREGDRQGAARAQDRALRSLRDGAEQVAKGGSGRGGTGAGGTGGRADPLGRGVSDEKMRRKGKPSGPEERARQVLEELRRRLGQSSRPQDEKDYLDSLVPKDRR